MKPRKVLVAALLGLGLAGCSARRSEAVRGEIRADTPQLQRGERAFMVFCHKCHPGGDAGLGPALNNKPLPKLAMRTQVRVGAGAMPSFSDRYISDEELDALLEYVVAVRKHRGR